MLTPETVAEVAELGRGWHGRPYDWAFGWGDDALYCSELVWKLFRRGAGVELAPLATLGDFDLDDPRIAAKGPERWGPRPPLGEPVVSPAARWRSDALVTVRAP